MIGVSRAQIFGHNGQALDVVSSVSVSTEKGVGRMRSRRSAVGITGTADQRNHSSGRGWKVWDSLYEAHYHSAHDLRKKKNKLVRITI